MNVTFIGHGYVGLVTAAVFADLGNTVWVVGRTPEKIARLKSGDPLIYEPGLEEMVKRNITAGRLIFTLDYHEGVAQSEIIFICVGTPPAKDGEADLSAVFSAAQSVAKNLANKTVVVVKSTVPPGTNKKVRAIIEKHKPKGIVFDTASSPEFLREGSAIADTLMPDRIVIGVNSSWAKEKLMEVHKTINAKLVVASIETAEMIKYSSNAFLSVKISFANALAQICEKVGADVEHVLEGVGLDRRIGRHFLYPGVGYGGSCFPKDVKALIALSDEVGYDFKLLKSVDETNDDAARFFINKITKHFGASIKGKTAGVLGLSFKPNTDDMREAPSLRVITALAKKGMKIKAYDPIAMEKARPLLPSTIAFASNAYEAAQGADCVVVVTEWNEFRQLDIDKLGKVLAKKVLFDGRNIYEPEIMKQKGYEYYSVGRS